MELSHLAHQISQSTLSGHGNLLLLEPVAQHQGLSGRTQVPPSFKTKALARGIGLERAPIRGCNLVQDFGRLGGLSSMTHQRLAPRRPVFF
jgi:hypothetical protein